MTTSMQPQRRTPRSGYTGEQTGAQTGRADAPATPSISDAELEPRFLGFLLPAVVGLAAKVAPQVGSTIGGWIGGKSGAQTGAGIGGAISGFLGGREIGAAPADVLILEGELNRAVEQQQLIQVITHLTQQCTPAIIQALKQAVQEHESRGHTGDIDDEAMERGWGFLTSLITDVVVSHAPDAIKLATKAFGSVIGSRDVDEYAPLLVDTEMTQRFVVPSIAAIVSGVQSVLPQLFSLLTSNREIPRDTGIGWSDLESTKRLWDNDNIAVLGTSPLDNPEETEFVLELAPHKTWWKGLQLQDDNGSFITEIGVQDRTKVATTRIRSQQLLSPGGYLVFMKAKAFGIHTGMYRLNTAGLEQQLKGQRVHFYWYAD